MYILYATFINIDTGYIHMYIYLPYITNLIMHMACVRHFLFLINHVNQRLDMEIGFVPWEIVYNYMRQSFESNHI